MVLQVVAFAFIFTYSPFHQSSYFNSSLTLVGWMKDMTHQINEPFTAMEENDQLKKENKRLLDQLANNYYLTDHQTYTISDSLFEQQYTYIPAKVIDNSYNKVQNYILINIGREHGIEDGMGVIGPKGIVGFVEDAGPKYSLVMPVINPNFSTPAKVKDRHYFGDLKWQQGDDKIARIDGLEKTNPVNLGDTIVTKGSTGRFPEGIGVGTIKKANEVAGDEEYDMEVNLFTNFQNLYYVYVVVNAHKQDLEDLRSKIDGNDD
jgi:rod shape-determining protein MreC